MLLNSDTELIENSIKFVYERSFSLNDLGAATVRLIYPDGEVQPAANYFPDIGLQFLEVTRLFRICKKYYFSKRPTIDYNKNFTADWIWGTFYFFPKKNLELFDGKLPDTFFMYGEDVEWGYLLAKKNLKSYYFSDSTIIHHSGKSLYKERNVALTKNSRHFIKKYYGNLHCFAFIFLTAAGNFIEGKKKKFHF